MDRNLNKLLSGSDALFLLDLIHESLSCKTEEDARKLINRLTCLIPYEQANSGLGRWPLNTDSPYDRLLPINYPLEWMNLYFSRGFALKDSIAIEHMKNFKLQYCADIIDRYGLEKEISSLAADFGLIKDGVAKSYIHGMKSSSEWSFFGFYGLKRHKRTETILNLLVPHLHEMLARTINISRNFSPLSQKEIEVLKWMSEGKSAWAASQILKVSENTVNFHIKNIKNKLDASNTAHAIAIALRAKLI